MATTVFVGFDSMDVLLTRRWAAEGLLPNFARLLEHWDSRPTQNPVGVLVGGLWPSFWSQSDVSQHGSYCWRQIVPGTYTTAVMTPTDFDTEPFWIGLDRAGVRCAILDVPLVRPIPLRNGVHIVDWGSHDSQLDPTITDPRVAEQFAALGPYPQKRCDITVEQHGHERLVADLRSGFVLRGNALRSLLAADYDLVVAVFSETHCTGHHFYHLHDETSPLHDAALRDRLGADPVLRLYQEADRELGLLLDAVSEDTAVMVLLSHGIGPHYDGNPMLDEILRRLAALHRPASRTTIARERVLVPLRGAGRRITRRVAPRSNPARNLRNLDGTAAWFEIPNNDLYGAVRINLRGREPWGRIRPGAELEETIALLTEEFLALHHVDSGAPAVRRVIRADDHYRGPRRDTLPDLFVEWNWAEPFRSLTSPSIGEVHSSARPLRTGDHRPHGEVFGRNIALPDTERIPVESLAAHLVRDALQRH